MKRTMIGTVVAIAVFASAGCGDQGRAAGCSEMGKAIAQADAASYAAGLARQANLEETRVYIRGVVGEKCLTADALQRQFGAAKRLVADCPECGRALKRAAARTS